MYLDLLYVVKPAKATRFSTEAGTVDITVFVRQGLTIMMLNVVVANFVGSAVTVPVNVTVYVPIWLKESL